MQALKVIFQLFLLCIPVWGWLILAIWLYSDYKKMQEEIKIQDSLIQGEEVYPMCSVIEREGFVWDKDLKEWKKDEQLV